MHNGINVLLVTQDHGLRCLVETSLKSNGLHSHWVPEIPEAIDILKLETKWHALVLDATKYEPRDKACALQLIPQFHSQNVCMIANAENYWWHDCAKLLNIGWVVASTELLENLSRLVAWCQRSAARFEARLAEPAKDSPTMYMESLDEERFFLAASPAMLELHKNVLKLASVDHPILILGESGVGKEIVARLLHKYQAPPNKKFINLNTAAIPSELLESELFGYEPGAFTGAIKAKPGKFELAHEGTLLLDEIGEMSPQMQAKLLHVLQDGMVTRLGGRCSQKVDVRILTATNVNIESAIAEKKFREDLYYRISTFTLTVPPLRERSEEIPLLMEQMALRAAKGVGQVPRKFSASLIEAAQEYHWPGNLRELRNFVTRLLVLQDEDSAYKQLRSITRTAVAVSASPVYCQPATPSRAASTGMKVIVGDMKRQVEGAMIRDALVASGWNRRRAASSLNISYRALLYKIQQHGLTT